MRPQGPDAWQRDTSRFPFTFLDHVPAHEPSCCRRFRPVGRDLDVQTQQRLRDFMRGTDEVDSLRVRLSKALEELLKSRPTRSAPSGQKPRCFEGQAAGRNHSMRSTAYNGSAGRPDSDR
jgi:hypothetical protein